MRKQFKKQILKHVALQIMISFCGAYIWYASSGMFCYPQADHKDWIAQHHAEIEYSIERVDMDNQKNTHSKIISSGMFLPEERALPSSIVELKIIEMSAYTSRVEETDETPCISADGTNICEYDGCVVASNDYSFGTKVIVDGFGECEVKDRMNSRYTGTGNMDIYFGKDLEGALSFGRKQVKIQITS